MHVLPLLTVFTIVGIEAVKYSGAIMMKCGRYH